MRIYSTFRKCAALCLAACAPALAFPAVAHAEASKSDCVELNALNSSFTMLISDLIDPKDMHILAKSGKGGAEAFSQSIGKRLFETDPITGKPRMDLFLEHLGDLAALAHDANGKIEDPEGAEAVEKLGDGIDGYLALIDRLKARTEDGETSDKEAADSDGSTDSGESDKEDSDLEAALDGMGPALNGFIKGLDTFTDYMDEAHCNA